VEWKCSAIVGNAVVTMVVSRAARSTASWCKYQYGPDWDVNNPSTISPAEKCERTHRAKIKTLSFSLFLSTSGMSGSFAILLSVDATDPTVR
jgi:hypothetical protein